MKPNRMNSIMNHARIGVCRLPFLLAIVGIAIALLAHTPVGWTANLQLGEPFNYADGSLDSRGISDGFGDFSNWGSHFEFEDSRWTSDWAIAPGSSLDFKVASTGLTLDAVAGVGPDANGNYSGSITRGLSIGTRGNSQTFAATFTEIDQPNANYTTTIGFGGTNGDTARVGIQNGQFVVQLGNQQQLRVGQVLPNTPYTVVGEVEFEVPVTVNGFAQTGERLTVWANETYRRMHEGTAIPLITVESVAGMTDLGDAVTIYARSSSPGDVAIATWDDLFIGTNYQEVNGFRHDIAPGDSNVQEGYFSWDVAVAGFVKMYPHAETGYGDVTMTIGGNNVVAVDAGSVGTVADDLLRDGVKGVGELTLRLEGLDGGPAPYGDPYVLKTYHNNPESQSGPIDVYLDVDGNEQLVATVAPSADDSVATHASIGFSALDEYAVFRFVARDGGDVWLNGFELVPEPNSSLTMLLGLIGLAAGGLRKRGR